MKDEYDFSQGERGKFYRPDAKFGFPVYLESDVEEYISKLAEETGASLQHLVNEWLRVGIKLVQSTRQTV